MKEKKILTESYLGSTNENEGKFLSFSEASSANSSKFAVFVEFNKPNILDIESELEC